MFYTFLGSFTVFALSIIAGDVHLLEEIMIDNAIWGS